MSLPIDTPRPDEAADLAGIHLRVWRETYPNPAAGIDDAWITGHLGHVVSPEGVERWRAVVEDAHRRPYRTLCRVVRTADGAPAGFVCGLREEPGGPATLGPMYLLPSVRRQGAGARLMDDFLEWAGGGTVRLWVTEYNEGAVRFYGRYGFRLTGERELWRGKLPNLRMVRAGDGSSAG